MTTTTGPSPRVLVLIYCGLWTLLVSVGSLSYAIWLLLELGLTSLVVNTTILTAASVLQALSGFYYLRKYLMKGMRSGWMALISPSNITKAPRKSLFVWICSTIILLLAFIRQIYLLSVFSANNSALLVTGWFLVGSNIAGFAGIIAGLILSGLFSECNEEVEPYSGDDADRIGRAQNEQDSPRRRR